MSLNAPNFLQLEPAAQDRVTGLSGPAHGLSMMAGIYVMAAAVNGADTAHRAAQMPAE